MKQFMTQNALKLQQMNKEYFEKKNNCGRYYLVDPNGNDTYWEKYNQWINYSGNLISLLDEEPKPPILDAVIRFDGVERFETRTEEYFRIVLPWKYHTSVTKNYIYIYSFATDPENLQPTGTANFSRLDSVTLHFRTIPGLRKSDISVYAINYNILRIISGIAGVLFAN